MFNQLGNYIMMLQFRVIETKTAKHLVMITPNHWDEFWGFSKHIKTLDK